MPSRASRSALIVAVSVLVPFFALVVLGWWFSRPVRPAVAVVPEPLADAAPKSANVPRGAVPPAVDAGQVSATPTSEPTPAFVSAVQAEVTRCLRDAASRGRLLVTVRFVPTFDGGYESVSSDAQDPMVAACVEDVFSELSFDPRSTVGLGHQEVVTFRVGSGDSD